VQPDRGREAALGAVEPIWVGRVNWRNQAVFQP
jgi:hypothetical protein